MAKVEGKVDPQDEAVIERLSHLRKVNTVMKQSIETALNATPQSEPLTQQSQGLEGILEWKPQLGNMSVEGGGEMEAGADGPAAGLNKG